MSPLWTILLAIGTPLGKALPIWAHLLGVVFLALTALYAYKLALRLLDGNKVLGFACALLTVVEFRLLWSAQSGLEMTLFTFLSLATIYAYLKNREQLRTALIFCGLALWTRPEGLLLFVALGLDGLIRRIRVREGNLKSWGRSALLFCGFFVPYLLFNLAKSGHLLGNLRTISGAGEPLSFSNYLSSVFLFFSQYHLVALFPFCLLFLLAFVMRMDRSDSFVPVIWSLLFIGAYAVIRPSNLANSIYLLPLLPLVILYALYSLTRFAEYSLKQATLLCGIYCLLIVFGFARLYPKGVYQLSLLPMAGIYLLLLCKHLTESPARQQRWHTALRAGMAVVLIGTVLGFGFYTQQRATAYASDVSNLKQRQIALAGWIDTNAPEDAVIATDSPGTLGFFANRRVLGIENFTVYSSVVDSVTQMRQRQVDYLLPFTPSTRQIASQAGLQTAYTSGSGGGCCSSPDAVYTLQSTLQSEPQVPQQGAPASCCGGSRPIGLDASAASQGGAGSCCEGQTNDCCGTSTTGQKSGDCCGSSGNPKANK